MTIPKALRERFGLRPGSQVEFREDSGRLVLAAEEPYRATLERLRGQGKGSLRRLGVHSVDELIELLRGR